MICSSKLAAISVIIVSLGGHSLLFASEGPSFDCAKAATWSEKAVCKDAVLCELDREGDSLYREAKTRLTPAAMDVLRGEQKDWLRKRENCKGSESPTACLMSVYRRRVEALAAWTGRTPFEEQEAKSPSQEALPLPEITAAVVWDGYAAGVHEKCEYGDYACVLDLMRSTGASEQARRFGERFEGWATDFRELGAVDVVGWVGAFAANFIQGEALVNGTPDVVVLNEYGFTEADLARPDVRAVLEPLPDGDLFSHRFVRKEATSDGSRFVVVADFARCNACRNEVLAHAEIAYDLDPRGTFQGSKLLSLRSGAAPPTERSPARSEQGSEGCKSSFRTLALGEAECGIGVAADGRLFVHDQALTGRIDSPLQATVFPLSPSARYAIVVIETGRAYAFVHLVDLEKRTESSIEIPTSRVSRWVSWSEDERFVVLASERRSNAEQPAIQWLQAVPIGTNEPFYSASAFRFPFDGSVVYPRALLAEGSSSDAFAWLGPKSLRVQLAECRGPECDRTKIPDDLTTVSLDLTDAGIEVAAIADPTKAPAAVLYALEKRRTAEAARARGEDCKYLVHKLPLGKRACGIELTMNGRVLVGGSEIPNVFDDSEDVPIEVQEVVVLPISPTGRYSVIDACSENCGHLYVLDHTKRTAKKFDGAIYGPTDWIAWSADEEYFLLQNHDDGVEWLQLEHLPGGDIDRLVGYNTDFAAWIAATNSFEWIGPRRFRVALMDACMEESCHELAFPQDLTDVVLDIANGRLEVKAIEDPSKVPAALRDALSERQMRVDLRDGTILNGEITIGTLTFASSLGTVEIPSEDIRSYEDDAARLGDGTVLKGRFGSGTIKISTIRGDLEIPANDIVGIARAKAGPGAATGGSPPPGQGTLTGRVLDNFQKPIGDARVQIAGSSLQTRTDTDGRYRLNYVPGRLEVGIEASGHDPIQFVLAPSAPAEYPVEDKVLLRIPSEPGVFYADIGGWTPLQACALKQTREIGDDIDFAGVRKETYRVTGSPSRVTGPSSLLFLDNTASNGELAIYRVDDNDEIVTDTRSGGLSGFASAMGFSQEKKATSHARYSRKELFPGRVFLYSDFQPGVYAVVDRSYESTCFKFQVGGDVARAAKASASGPDETRSLLVDGKSVSFWLSPGSVQEAHFQIESKGYRNTYKIDCTAKQFIWTENFRLRTAEVTGNSAGAEWKPLNPNSTVANSVFGAACR